MVPEFAELFSAEEIGCARQRLAQFGHVAGEESGASTS